MNEDFVPFELAVKLKEKGFDWQTFDWYDIAGDFNRGFMPRELGCQECYAPTISQVLKWLRDEKKIHVVLYPTPGGFHTEIYNHVGHYYNSEAERYLLGYRKEKTLTNGITWEYALGCALRYVLDNLI